MKIGDWYRQVFSDKEIYFLPLTLQKNGGWAGVAITVDLMKPRAQPKAKKSSVPKGFAILWKPCVAPYEVLRAASEKV